MTTQYRLVALVVLASLLLALSVPAIALAQGPMTGGMVGAPVHHGGGHPGHGYGHGGHRSGWGQYAMLDAFAAVLGMTPSELSAEIQAGQTLAELAQERGIDRTDVVDAVVERMTGWMDECLQAGHMDEEQFEWMEEHLRQHVDWLMDNSNALLYEWHHGAAFGPGWGHGFGGLLWAAAEVLDMSPWDIRDALYEGQTIADLAGNDQTVIDEIVRVFMEPRIEALQAAVTAGHLAQEQANWIQAEMEEHARWLIENTPPMGQFGHGAWGGGCH